MRYVVFVAMLLSFVVVQRSGLQAAFLRVWIPVFLAMPTMFWVNIPGLPDPNFMQAAIIPLMLVLVRDHLDRMRLGPMEMLILLYLVIRVFADFLGRGYSDAQNYAFYLLTSLVGPYLLGRYVIDSRRMDIATAKVFVTMFVIFFPMFLYEAKFWVSPIYKLVSPLFPGSFSGLSLRWGIARTAGTFEHPILACIMIIAAYRLHRWLSWVGAWRGPQTGFYGWWQRQTVGLPLRLEDQVALVLIVMALMTISRGPWIGGLAAAVLVAVGNLKNRRRGLVAVGLLFLVGGIGGKLALDAYLTPAMGEVLSGEAQTMLYRKEMIDRYKQFLLDKIWWGWGLTYVPKIRGMESVDNAFFLMALQHGVFAPTVFVVIFLYAIVTQILFGLKAPVGTAPIGFTFSGIYLMCFVSFATVYMGAQTEPLLFLLLGWGESIKARGHEAVSGPGGPAPPPTPPHPFRRVLF